MEDGRSWLGSPVRLRHWHFLDLDGTYHPPGEAQTHTVEIANHYGAVLDLFEDALICENQIDVSSRETRIIFPECADCLGGMETHDAQRRLTPELSRTAQVSFKMEPARHRSVE